MLTREKNKSVMLGGLVAVGLKYADNDVVPAVVRNGFVRLQSKLDEIEHYDQVQQHIFKGAADEKQKAAEKLIDLVMQVAGCLVVIGNNTLDAKLIADCSIERSHLVRMINRGLAGKARVILDHTTRHAAELDAMEIDQAFRDNFAAAIVSFRAFSGGKERKQAEKTAARKALTISFAGADLVVNDELDKLMLMVKDTVPDFYREYIAARNIRDLGVKAVKRNGNGNGQSEKPASEAPVSKTA
jgi:hypothetical protein